MTVQQLRRLWRWLRNGLIGLALGSLALAGAGWVFLARSLPQTSGTIALNGLSAPARIERDERGVVHISAATLTDAFFALGFAHAQDRLFQMDFQRRIGSGRLAEILGERALATDRTLRTFGLERVSE